MSAPFAAKEDYGWTDHRRSQESEHQTRTRPVAGELTQHIADAIGHLQALERWWNKHAKKSGLPIRASAKKIINRLRQADYGAFYDYFTRQDDSGVLHETAIITVIDIICQCLRYPDKCGLLLGALQGGKTMAAIASQWLGPVNYLMTGNKVKLIYLITSQTSHEDQAKYELERFLKWYGDIELIFDRTTKCSLIEYQKSVEIDDYFQHQPTLNNYRNVVLGKDEYGDFVVDHSGFLVRRVHGSAIPKIAELCRKANEKNIEPILMLDEAQNGASDQDVRDETTGRDRRPCVLRQILDRIMEACEGRRVRYIAISATPYELYDVAENDLPPKGFSSRHVWKVHLALSEKYVGFNYFGGEVICDGVKIKTPTIHSFTTFGLDHQLPLLAGGQFDPTIWAMQHKHDDVDVRFARWKKRRHYNGTYEQYVEAFLESIRRIVTTIVADESEPVGICIRLCNSNALTNIFIDDLDLDPDEFEVLKFIRENEDIEPTPGTKKPPRSRPKPTGSIKRFLFHNRKRRELPYVVFVTNKARMGDAFPGNVKYFIECPSIASDMNALLQGLVGRACGYDKDTTVILSERNHEIISDWITKHGAHVYRTSRHSIPVRLRRGPPLNMIKLTTEMDDPKVQAFFAQINAQIIEPMIEQNIGFLKTKTKMSRGQPRTGPILAIANKLKLFDHLEQRDVQDRLFPSMHTPIEIARPNGKPVIGRDKDGKRQVQSYVIPDPTKPGYCAFTFRHSESARGGRAGRGVHTVDTGRDSKTDRARVDGKLEPQINLEKYNARTGKVFDDRLDEHGGKIPEKLRKKGLWRVHMVTLPLVVSVREIEVGEAAYAVKHSPFNEHVEDDERVLRDDEVENPQTKQRWRRRAK